MFFADAFYLLHPLFFSNEPFCIFFMIVVQFEMAEECLKHAMDFSGMLLLYSSIGDAEGISKLATLAKEQGKNNVAFLCLFMLGKLEECLQLLIDRLDFFSILK